MTVEEYLQLIESGRPSKTGMSPSQAARRVTKKIARKKGKKDPKMAKALRKANKMMRTKSGKLRKGATQAKIMKKAHQLRRKMS